MSADGVSPRECHLRWPRGPDRRAASAATRPEQGSGCKETHVADSRSPEEIRAATPARRGADARQPGRLDAAPAQPLPVLAALIVIAARRRLVADASAARRAAGARGAGRRPSRNSGGPPNRTARSRRRPSGTHAPGTTQDRSRGRGAPQAHRHAQASASLASHRRSRDGRRRRRRSASKRAPLPRRQRRRRRRPQRNPPKTASDSAAAPATPRSRRRHGAARLRAASRPATGSRSSAPRRHADAAALPTIWELPFSTRKDIPALDLSMHVYSSDPKQRFVVIKGDRHVEGDEIAWTCAARDPSGRARARIQGTEVLLSAQRAVTTVATGIRDSGRGETVSIDGARVDRGARLLMSVPYSRPARRCSSS